MKDDVSKKIEEFFESYKIRKYPKGQILILADAYPGFVLYMLSGKVKQYDVSNRGDEVILNVFKPPAFFPMSLVINKTKNPYIFEAETDVELRQAPADEVVAFIKENPDVMYDLLSRLYRGVDGVLGRMVQLMSNSARNRLLYELLIEVHRFGTKLKDGGFTITINEKELGSRAGMTRETVSREIHKLKEEKLVSVKNGAIVLGDIKALESKLGLTL